MDNSEQLIQVIAAVVVRDGRYLVCKRPGHKRHGDLWEFPGGKLEPDENWLAAARRELAEELHLSVESVGDVRFVLRDPGSQFVVNFIDVAASGSPVPTEHSDVAWLTVDELLALPLAPTDRQFVASIFSGEKQSKC